MVLSYVKPPALHIVLKFISLFAYKMPHIPMALYKQQYHVPVDRDIAICCLSSPPPTGPYPGLALAWSCPQGGARCLGLGLPWCPWPPAPGGMVGQGLSARPCTGRAPWGSPTSHQSLGSPWCWQGPGCFFLLSCASALSLGVA